jgi:ankyrin repeat protein
MISVVPRGAPRFWVFMDVDLVDIGELTAAIVAGDVAAVQGMLTADNVNMSLQDAYSMTPLFLAVNWKHMDLIVFLLDLGADPNATATGDLAGFTPLFDCVESGLLDLARVLFLRGAGEFVVERVKCLTPLCSAEPSQRPRLHPHGFWHSVRTGR